MLENTSDVISSPGSEDGTSRCNCADGLQMNLFGPSVVPAHRSALRLGNAVFVRNAKTKTLYGMLDVLASRYVQTASMSGLKTVATYGRKPGDSSPSGGLQRSLASRLAARVVTNGSQVCAHRWKLRDMRLGPRICRVLSSGRLTSDNGSSLWATPLTENENRPTKGTHSSLNPQVVWSTPTARDAKDTPTENVPVNGYLGREVYGPKPSRTCAQMERKGRLNPAFCRWLMGYPKGWDASADTATALYHRWRRHSSRRIWKRGEVHSKEDESKTVGYGDGTLQEEIARWP